MSVEDKTARYKPNKYFVLQKTQTFRLLNIKEKMKRYITKIRYSHHVAFFNMLLTVCRHVNGNHVTFVFPMKYIKPL